jgi:hypothetical protein
MLRKPPGKYSFIPAIFVFYLLAGNSPAAAGEHKLKPDEQKVVDYLVKDWGQDYSVTSVDVAMRALRLPPSDETRYHIGSYIKQHPELHEVLRNWGWVTVVLTPDEKLTARDLINAQHEGKPAPSLDEIAGAVALSQEQTKRGLAMLERYEIIRRDASRGGAGYAVLPHYINWEPRLDFLFHQVTLASGRQFNTN